jgi:hypothetical protein
MIAANPIEVYAEYQIQVGIKGGNGGGEREGGGGGKREEDEMERQKMCEIKKEAKKAHLTVPHFRCTLR